MKFWFQTEELSNVSWILKIVLVSKLQNKQKFLFRKIFRNVVQLENLFSRILWSILCKQPKDKDCEFLENIRNTMKFLLNIFHPESVLCMNEHVIDAFRYFCLIWKYIPTQGRFWCHLCQVACCLSWIKEFVIKFQWVWQYFGWIIISKLHQSPLHFQNCGRYNNYSRRLFKHVFRKIEKNSL